MCADRHRGRFPAGDAASVNAAVVLRYDSGEIQTVLAILTGPNELYIDGNPDPSQEIDVGLTVEVEAEHSGVFRVVRVVAPSPYIHWTCTLPEPYFESVEFEDLCRLLWKEGCRWERFPAGVLHVHQPRDSDLAMLRLLEHMR